MPLRAADMTGRGRPWSQDDFEIFRHYLQAVVNVYGPWTASPIVSPMERRLAHDRVAQAQHQLDLMANHPSFAANESADGATQSSLPLPEAEGSRRG
ncbi:hypothetical protein EDD29_5757 [Actinocorallia herbida]|uniref:Uncharacterized protein n=1 Tax=Actinocorallia herbida TaxID=58109 RepID=A0A3N1D3L6_9ACTN|nr:hypothetical protein [Actinocorallia herbida]ROO88099.1 hypothetical protein EDD29_5757 [Actinocorallia herbida]